MYVIYRMTGFHGLHVAVGIVFLVLTCGRMELGQMNEQRHFSIIDSFWYWYFVDVILVLLFFFPVSYLTTVIIKPCNVKPRKSYPWLFKYYAGVVEIC